MSVASKAKQGAEMIIDGPLGISLLGVCKEYKSLDAVVKAVDNVTLKITPGESVAVLGSSGSGKSTLLQLIGALDVPDRGTITVDGVSVSGLRGSALDVYRRGIGFVFQRFHLISSLSVLENILVPIQGVRRVNDSDRDAARDLLADVGLAGRENTLATRLSGGQQQRVAIARALVTRPSIIIADEPTGNLDSKSSAIIENLLLSMSMANGCTLICATHDPTFAEKFSRRITMTDGRSIEG